jgi:hypothetical protein
LTVVHSGGAEPIYRYSDTRTRYPDRRRAAVILYNPVHKGEKRDQTTGKCMTWLCADGEFGVVEFVNIYAYRHENPLALLDLRAQGVDVVGPQNDRHIRDAIDNAELVVVAWGANAARVDPLRPHAVLGWMRDPYCFGSNADGSPVHPNRRGLTKGVTGVPYDGRG